jgi:hypothetical protein
MRLFTFDVQPRSAAAGFEHVRQAGGLLLGEQDDAGCSVQGAEAEQLPASRNDALGSSQGPA